MDKKKILFVASEAVPFIKTGGLADVVGTLPKYFNKKEYDVRVFLPKYACIDLKAKDNLIYKTHFYMDISWRCQYVGIFEAVIDDVTFYFVDNEYYFNGEKPYGEEKWDIERFSYFSRAVLSSLPVIDFRPDVIHCHDWQAGLVPVYLNDSFQGNQFYQNIKTVITIHNLKFQGRYNKYTVADLTGLSMYYFEPDKLELYGDGNLLKGGIVYADRITTVSDTYSKEIQTEYYGEKLDGLLNAKSSALSGIINGIDYEMFNPSKDACLKNNYSASNFKSKKCANKLLLQEELGLNQDKNVMMIGIVSRLTDQKGMDLIAYVMDELCNDPIQLVVLGTGNQQYENMFKYFEEKYKGKVSANIFYSDELARKIYGSCDAFLMPSLYEPCGLSQLISLKYGTVPIVRETGGLKDTVTPYNEFEETGIGFSFANYNAHDMLNVIRYAEQVFYDNKTSWNALVRRGMKADYSWKASALKYQELYSDLLS